MNLVARKIDGVRDLRAPTWIFYWAARGPERAAVFHDNAIGRDE